jgi:hypothetical protein
MRGLHLAANKVLAELLPNRRLLEDGICLAEFGQDEILHRGVRLDLLGAFMGGGLRWCGRLYRLANRR